MQNFEFKFFNLEHWKNILKHVKKEEVLVLIPIDIWTDIIVADGLNNLFDPCTTNKTVKEAGLLGTIETVPIYTDSFREKELQFLKGHEIFVVPKCFEDVFLEITNRKEFESYIEKAQKDLEQVGNFMYGIRKRFEEEAC